MRTLLVTGRNVGFFSLFLQVIDNCMTAEREGLRVWVEFGREVRAYWDGTNVWETFFEQPMLGERPGQFDLQSSCFGGHPGGYGTQQLRYRIEHLTTDERIRYNAAIRAYARLKPGIRDKAHAFIASLPPDYVAIHIRGTDRYKDATMRPLDDYLQCLRTHADRPVVVCADSHEAVAAARRVHPEVYADDAVRQERYNDTTPVHKPGLYAPRRIAEDVIIDMLVMANAGLLIHSGSNVSLTSWLWNTSLAHEVVPLERKVRSVR